MLNSLRSDLAQSGNKRLLAEVEFQLSIEYREAGLLELALRYGQSATKTFESIGLPQPLGLALKEESRTLNALGHVELALKARKRARRNAELAHDEVLLADLKLDEASHVFEDALTTLTRDPTIARTVQRLAMEALTTYEQHRNSLGVANARSLIGRLAFLQQSPDVDVNVALMEYSRLSADAYARAGNSRGYLGQLMTLAQMEGVLQNQERASELSAEMVRVLEQQRDLLKSPFSRRELLQRWEDAYELELIAALNDSDLNRAFDCLLQLRARTLDELATSAIDLGSDAALERRRDLGKLADAALTGTVGSISDYRLAARSHDEKLHEQELKLDLPAMLPLTSGEALRILDPLKDAALLDMFAGRNAVGALRVSHAGIDPLAWDIGQDRELTRLVRAFGAGDLGGSLATLRARLTELWRYLTKEDAPSSPGTLFLATQGDFRSVPLHALPFLHEGWRNKLVAYVPSVRTIDRTTHSPDSRGKPRVLLVDADPAMLPGVRHEIALLKHIYEADEVDVDSCGSSIQLISAYDSWDVLHVASHGFVQPGSPCGTGLLLRGDNGATELVGIPDLQRLRLHARIVVLTGCSTAATIGRGRQIEFLGLVSALMSATGARAVVAPLWPVLDDVARDVSVALHEALLQGSPIGEALTLACLDVATRRGFLQDTMPKKVESPRSLHPAARSVVAFACFGNPSVGLRD